MKPLSLLAAAAASLSLASVAQAQIAGVDSICEPQANGSVNTVKVRLMSLALLDFIFTPVGPGQTVTSPAGQLSSAPRKVALPAGTYTFTYKHPNTTPFGTYFKPVVVKPFRVVGGACVPIRIDKQVDRAAQAVR